MTQGFTSLIRIFVMVIGNTMNSHKTFVDHLKLSLNLTEVNSEEECDVIMAFVSIVSRAGTDIEAALLQIPATRPVVLIVFHHTFDEYYMAPDSRLCVRSRSDVFAVDCLHHEDQGLLRCLRNDDALMAVKHHLSAYVLPKVKRSDNTFFPYPLTFTQVIQSDVTFVTIATLIFIIIMLTLIVILSGKL
ncbi:uncharacterized protein LOC143485706 [Brachyhypopomus gauderio]|uniref:uncharacterized protein LOC143485706 n=1 Tax=Brachyhypopomus gauderio TaxID=698409 RepID=UPI004041929D